jgi:predicted small lipoprotein YifL
MKTIILAACVALALAACERKGPVEKAGAAVDRAVDQTGRAIEKAGENVRDAAKK